MKREEAFDLVKQNIKRENLLKHMLAVEAIMRKTAEFLGEDKEKWGLVGLLHDIDFEKMKEPKDHGVMATDILRRKVDDETLHAIKAHNYEYTGATPNSKLDYSLIAADSISGLIIACALVMPSKKLAEVRVDSIAKRFKEKDFARNCIRDRILFCEKVSVSKEKFYEIALKALQDNAESLGL
jgi:putative nucleotidyltransferase with HDIG domain